MILLVTLGLILGKNVLFVLNSIIQHVLTNKGRLYSVFVDLKKAFDSIYHKGLWYKLYQVGIQGKLLRITRDMYSTVLRVRCCSDYLDFF